MQGVPARMVGYWRRARSRRHRRRSESRRRPPDSYFYDSSQSSSSNNNNGGRHHRNARTVFICGCRIDVSFTPRGRRSDSRSASLIAEANTLSLTARAANLLEFDPGGPGDPMKADGEAVPRERLSRGTRRRLALCEFDVYATPNTPTTRSRTTRRRRSDSNNDRVRVSLKSSSFEYESSISSSRVGDFVYSSTTMMSAPMLEPQPQLETPPPDDMSDINDLSDRRWIIQQLPSLASDLTLGAFAATRPRSRISVGCNGWITADTPPKSVARLSEIVEDVVSPEQSQFSVRIGDDTSETISKYAADSFRGLAPMGINFDLVSVGHSSSRGGEQERASVDSASSSSARQRRRVSPAGSSSLDDVVSRQSDVSYRITEDAALLQIRHSKPDESDKNSATPPADTRKSKAQHSLLPFRMRRSRQQQQQQQQQSAATPPVAQSQESAASLRPSIIYIDCHT